MTEMDVLIGTSAVVGLLLIYWGKKRKFSRLNQLGIEQFSSYGQKIGAMTLDALLLGGGFGLLGIAGIVCLFEYAKPLFSLLVLLPIGWAIDDVYRKSPRVPQLSIKSGLF